MSQIGYTDWIVADTSSNPIFTDTYIDENDATGGPFHASNDLYIKGTKAAATQKVSILDISIPNKKDLIDSDGNDLPTDVEFSKIEMRINVSVDPASTTEVVGGVLLTKAVVINLTNWNTTDGTTAWYPDLEGDGTNAIVYSDLLCQATFDTSSTGWNTFTFQNLAKNKISFGSQFQLALYGAGEEIKFDSANNSGDPPALKVYFRKPEPDAAKIILTPDDYGLNGTIDIKQHTKDANLQKYYASWDVGATVVQSDNPLTITDIAKDSIPISDLVQEALSGPPAYTKRWPLAFNESLSFALFSEDNYNKVTNAIKSNAITMVSTGTIPVRPTITSFNCYNAAGVADVAPAIGEEMTLTILTSNAFAEYGVLFDVEASLVDTGITWEDDSPAGSTMTSTTSNAAYTKLYNSDPDGLMLGDMLKITSAAGPEFMKVVGHDSGFTVVERAQMNTAAVDHTGLADTTKIYKINYDDVVFTKLNSDTALHSLKHTFSKSSTDIHTNHVAAVVKNKYGWASDLQSLNFRAGTTVGESNPIAKLTTSRTKVPYAKYGDQTTGFTLSLSNSKAVGSNRKINQHGFTYDAFSSDTVATANALTNNNECFESGTKRVGLISTGADSLTDSTWRIFGLASYESNGTSKIEDSNVDFSHYKYVSEQVTVGARLTPVVTTNYWKNIECVVCEEIDSDDDGNRFLLMVNPADLTSYDASVLNEGDGGVDLSTSEPGVTIVDSSFYKAGDVVKIGNELCLVESVDSSVAITVRRGYLFTTATEHNDPAAVYLIESKELKHTWVNRELRCKGDMSSANTATRYMWGGFAQIIADDIDFEAGPLMSLDGVTAASSFNDTDWYANGFAIGDIIKVKSNQTENGTYAAPGYYKIMDIRQSSGSGDYDYIYIAEHANMLSDDEALYVSISITTNSTKTADIVRYDNARNPTMTCALYNYSASGNAYTGDSDTVKFEGFVVDDDTTSFLANTATDTLTVRGVGLSTLNLDTLVDSGDIAISSFNLSRQGGASATMPLGDRRYPIGGTVSKLGLIDMSVSIRILTQDGYRQIYSLIEGDRYDYVFLKTNDVDAPSSSYKTYRMKLNTGTLNKTSELASQYTASLSLLVLGEDIT